jgi:iron complex outermembrane receptor protein
MKSTLIIISLSFFSWSLLAQEKKDVDLYDLSLEELMKIRIVSASKKEETLFDAPLSSYTITKDDIKKAGSTSVMEALRLAPGVIVREQTNGAYDIHIRGFDNILRHSETFTKSNLATLVMIDNRPVFNHNLGGTLWEALPIDLNDVERIEIVRGPSAPLFGPNAVSGVINIITRHADFNGTYATANVQYGTPATMIANGTITRKINKKFAASGSVNYQQRERFDTDYYNVQTGEYQPIDAIFPGVSASRYPDPERAMKKWGANASFLYNASEKINFTIAAGLQDSEVQKIFSGGGASTGNGTFFTTNQTESQYANLVGKVFGFTLRGSYLLGHDVINLNSAPNQYDYKIGEVTGEYEIRVGDKISIVPGISYQDIKYGDEDYITEGLTFLGGKEVNINTTSGFIRTDIKPFKNLRVLAAARADKFSIPDKTYLAYEFATTYKLGENHLLRAAITRSNSGSFIANNYLNLVVPNGAGPGVDYVRRGQPDLDLLTINMIEFGYRAQITKGFQLDVDFFQQKADKMTALILKGIQFTPSLMYLQESDNIPTTATQQGATLSLNFVPNEKFQFKPSITIQQTTTDSLLTAYALGAPKINGKHTNTPSVFGGYYLNFKATTKLNINLNGYYFAAHRQYDVSDMTDTSEAGNIRGKVLVNAKVSYALSEKINVYLNGRNITNSDSREYFGADKSSGLYLIGASFQLN